MSGIEWDKDWTCCDVMIPANKKRCGKCHGWRGGKRVAAKKQKTPVPTMPAVAVTAEAAGTPSEAYDSLVVAPALPPLEHIEAYTTTEFI